MTAQIISNGLEVDSLVCTGFELIECFVSTDGPVSIQTTVIGEFVQGSNPVSLAIQFFLDDVMYFSNNLFEPVVPFQDSANLTHDCLNSASGVITLDSIDIASSYSLFLGSPLSGNFEAQNNLSAGTDAFLYQDHICGTSGVEALTVHGGVVIDSISVAYNCYNDIGILTPNISGNGSGDFTYSWTGPNGFVSSDEQAFITDSGSYTLELVDSESDCSAIATIVVGDTMGAIFPDVNCDCEVNAIELLQFLGVFGLTINDPSYNPYWDFNSDGIINNLDLLLFLGDFGMSVCN